MTHADLLAAQGLTVFSLTAAALMTFGAAFVRGLTGFGMAIILVPLLGIFIPPGKAVVLAILLQLLIGPVGLPQIARNAQRWSALPIAGLAMLATPLGILMLKGTSPDVARLLIAMVALGAFALILLPRHAADHRPGAAMILGTGISSGFLTGFAAMPGPPVVPFYLRQQITPVEARASMMLIFFATAIAGTLALLASEMADLGTLLLAALLFLPMMLGNSLGARLFGRVPEPLWRSAVGAVLGLAGVAAVVRLVN
jgi:uncharacterized protein